ncbi:MAG TPA: hypothetical protein VFG68_05305 [Fimbriiglobus sp.]|nr:hypothetical protein [Fimbriiglobus sp.]
MNAAYLLMSLTLSAGQETPPPAAPVPAPAVVAPAPTWPSPAYGVMNGGCSSCGAGIAPGCSDPCPCGGRKGLFGRRKGDCDCSPKKDRRRLFHGFTTSACDDCGKDRGGLLSRLSARFQKGDDGCDAGCGTVGGCGASMWGGPSIGGCALPPVPSYAPPGATPAPAPQPMEKPKETPKVSGTTTNVSLRLPAPTLIPAPTPVPVPAIPVLADKKSPF